MVYGSEELVRSLMHGVLAVESTTPSPPAPAGERLSTVSAAQAAGLVNWQPSPAEVERQARGATRAAHIRWRRRRTAPPCRAHTT